MSSDESEGSEGIGVLRLHIHKLPRIHSGKVHILSILPTEYSARLIQFPLCVPSADYCQHTATRLESNRGRAAESSAHKVGLANVTRER